MSAYQVSRSHIATMAAYACGGSFRISTRFGSLVDVANKLAAANVESLQARYPAEPWAPDVFSGEGDVYKSVRLELLQPMVMIKAAYCLEYQSCEHAGWVGSEAYDICQQIRAAAIRELPGYDEAAGWSIEDKPAAVASGHVKGSLPA